MSEAQPHFTPPALPQAVIEKPRAIPLIWLIPLLAALIGGWLIYRTVSESGPTITIDFKNAAGLEAGKTNIKYKSVTIGQVQKIAMRNLQYVTVTAQLDKSGEQFMTENSRFWVVRPRIGGSEISGLETIVSGAYISIDPRPGPPALKFKGLETPPGVLAAEEGAQFNLHAVELGSAYPGTPILHRGVQVGRVVNYKFAPGGDGVLIGIFIKAPYHRLVRDTSRFWQKTGINISYGIEGLEVNVQSLATLIAGGIAFDNPSTASGSNEPCKAGTTFKLFKDFKSVGESRYVRKVPYLLHFNDSLRGLSEGAPVEFRGIKVGYVTDVAVAISPDSMEIETPVVIELEPERLTVPGFLKTHQPHELATLMVKRGLRAQLKMGSLLSGQLFVELDFHPELPKKALLMSGKYPEIPTISSTMDELSKNATEVLSEIRQIPFDKIGRQLLETIQGAKKVTTSPELTEALRTFNRTMGEIHAMTRADGVLSKSFKNVNTLTENLNTRVAKLDTNIEKTLRSIRTAMKTAAPNSPAAVNLTSALEELSAAARSVRGLTDYLNRHPEALLRGKKGSKK